MIPSILMGDHNDATTTLPKEGSAQRMSGKQSMAQKRHRSVTPNRPVAIAPKTDPSKNLRNFELNQSIVIKSESHFVTLVPKTNIIPPDHNNRLIPTFDQFCMTKKNFDNARNVSSSEGAKRMKLASRSIPAQYILLRNQNLHTTNTIVRRKSGEKVILQQKTGTQEYETVDKSMCNANNSLNMCSTADSVNSVSCKFSSTEVDQVPVLPSLVNSNDAVNRMASVTSSLGATIAFPGLSNEHESTYSNNAMNSEQSNSGTNMATAKLPVPLKSRSQKPVVIMQQLLSPGKILNSPKSKENILQGLNKLLPLNIRDTKIDSKIFAEQTSSTKTNEINNDETKIVHADVTKSNVEQKNDFILRAEEFPAISSSQVDSVLKAIDMQSHVKGFTLNEADFNAKNNREVSRMKETQSLPCNQVVTKSTKSESIRYNDTMINTSAKEPAKPELNRPVKRTQNQKRNLVQPLEKYIDTLQCYKCKECPYMSLNDQHIVEHIEKEHSIVTKKQEKPIMKCPGCTNTFHYSTSLLSHIVHDHQVHESEARVMMQKLCHRENPIDESNSPKLSSHIQDIEVQYKECTPKQAKTEHLEASGQSQCVENMTLLHQHHALTPDIVNTNVHTIVNNISIERNVESHYVQDLDIVPAVIADNVENMNLQNVPFLNDIKLSPLKNEIQSRNVKVLESRKDNPSKNFNVPQTKVGERNFEFVSFKSGGENYLREDEVADHAVSVEEMTFVDIPDSELDQENMKLETKKVKPKKKGRPKGSKTSNAKQTPADLKHLGYKCELEDCGVRMLAQENIMYHRKCHASSDIKSITSYQCPECLKFRCSNWNNLAGHLWRSHIIDMELHACDVCSYKTPSLSNLINQHKGIHGDDRPYSCDNCGKGFKTTKQLRNHRALHRAKDKQPLECSECKRVFTNMRLLKLHTDSVHKDSKPFVCNFCAYSASTRSALKLHLRRHTGEKPFSCEQCPYSTGDHNSLRRHKLRHLGLKPYSCPHCSYACIQTSTYKVHLKNKHPGLDHGLMFSCQYCSYRSVKKENLLTHMAKHDQVSSKASGTRQSPLLIE